jgi:hypothetical protein
VFCEPPKNIVLEARQKMEDLWYGITILILTAISTWYGMRTYHLVHTQYHFIQRQCECHGNVATLVTHKHTTPSEMATLMQKRHEDQQAKLITERVAALM